MQVYYFLLYCSFWLGWLGRIGEGVAPIIGTPGNFIKKGFLTLPAKEKKFPAKEKKFPAKEKNSQQKKIKTYQK